MKLFDMKDAGASPASLAMVRSNAPLRILNGRPRPVPSDLSREFTRAMYEESLVELRRYMAEVQELRGSLENPQTPLSYPAEWLLDIFNGGRTDSGLRVSEMTALQVAAVCSCVNIVGNGVASLPLNVLLKEMDHGRVKKTVAYDHYLQELLHSEPNVEMTSVTWRRTLMAHICLWGNGYCEIQRNNANQITALWPRNPGRTRPVRLTTGLTWEGDFYPPGTLCYETYDNMGDAQVWDTDGPDNRIGVRRLVLAEDMIHVPGLSLDGRLGQDVVHLGRQAIGLSLATEKYGAKFFGNGAIPTGILGVPGDMTEVQWEVLKRSWAESHGGENRHKTGVLPPGVTYTKTGATPEEGQMLQTRAYQRVEIASLFGVPGHMVGADEKGAKGNVEQASIEFVLYCLGPHLNAIEHELKRKLFPKVGQNAGKYHVAFNTQKLMYPDAASRTTFYGGGKQWGYLSTNDVRELEGMNPVDDGSGDVLWMPMNMGDAAAMAKQSSQASDAMDEGTLQSVPPNTVPVNTHPVAQHNAKVAKVQAGAQIAAAAAARPKVVGGPGTQSGGPGAGGPGGGSGKKNAAGKRGLELAGEFAVKAYGGMFQDAVHRAIFRKKPNAADYTTIFGPLVATLADVLEVNLPVNAIQEHITEIFKRGAAWKEVNASEIAKAECVAMAEMVWRSAEEPEAAHSRLANEHHEAAAEAGDEETAEANRKAATAHIAARTALRESGVDSAAYKEAKDKAYAATSVANS